MIPGRDPPVREGAGPRLRPILGHTGLDSIKQILLARNREETGNMGNRIPTCALSRRRRDSSLRSFPGYGGLTPPHRTGPPKWCSVGVCPEIGTITGHWGNPARKSPLGSNSCRPTEASNPSRSANRILTRKKKPVTLVFFTFRRRYLGMGLSRQWKVWMALSRHGQPMTAIVSWGKSYPGKRGNACGSGERGQTPRTGGLG